MVRHTRLMRLMLVTERPRTVIRGEFRHWKGNRLEINVTVWEYGVRNMRKRNVFSSGLGI